MIQKRERLTFPFFYVQEVRSSKIARNHVPDDFNRLHPCKRPAFLIFACMDAGKGEFVWNINRFRHPWRSCRERTGVSSDGILDKT